MDLKHLLSEMTLDEKIGQLVQTTPNAYGKEGFITGPLIDGVEDVLSPYLYGSVLGTKSKEEVFEIQKEYLEKHRLKIPLLFMADIIHGHNTIFPIPLALSNTWNPDTVKNVAQWSAKEASSQAIQVTFSPMADHMEDPRWGRVLEGHGEDNLLNATLTKAWVEGYQGDNLKDPQTLASCVKHFVGYAESQGGRDYNHVDFSRNALFNKHLPSFKAAIDANVAMVMTSFNTFEGIPASANSYLLREVLRDALKFKGMVISDWASIREMITHGFVKDAKEAAHQSFLSGVDVDMMGYCYPLALKTLIENHDISEESLDQAVMNVLILKEKLGLFENPYRVYNGSLEGIEEAVYESAVESLVLLKNNANTLPLSHPACVCGPFATSQELLGSWSYQGDSTGVQSIQSIFEASNHCDRSDTVVYIGGEPEFDSGEGKSKVNINLPQNQIEDLKQLKALGKTVILVVLSGRPMVLSEVEAYTDAILLAHFPGKHAPLAIHDVLYGIKNPSGKLAMSLPRHVGQIPLTYASYTTGRPYDGINPDQYYCSRYLDVENDPLYSFGHGLSYSTFEIESYSIDSTTPSEEHPLTLCVTIKNTSDRDGSTVLQVYQQSRYSGIVRPQRELIAFKKISVPKQSSLSVDFTIDIAAFGTYNHQMQRIVSKSEVELFVGFDTTAQSIGPIHLQDDIIILN